MTFSYSRSYRGPIQAVLLDWAGTTMDFGCCAPAVVVMEVFQRQGVPITLEEARVPMGAHKRVHIQSIGRLETVSGRATNRIPLFAPAKCQPGVRFRICACRTSSI